MLKIITKSMFFLLALSLMIAINQVALATEEYVVNGQEVNYAGLENKVKGILVEPLVVFSSFLLL